MSDVRICHEIRSLMADWLDGELSATLNARVYEHLAGCADCHAAFSTMRALGDDLSMLGRAADRIAETAAIGAGRSGQWRRPWVRAAAIVLMVAGGIYFVGTRLPRPHADSLVKRTTGHRIDARAASNETTVVPEGECRAEGRTAVAIATVNPRVRIVWLFENRNVTDGSTPSSGGVKPRPQS